MCNNEIGAWLPLGGSSPCAELLAPVAMSWWSRLIPPTELVWSAGLLLFAGAPSYCVYQLYSMSQAGKLSTRENENPENLLLDRRPQKIFPPVPQEEAPSAWRTWISPHAAAEAVAGLLDRYEKKPKT